MLTPPLTALPWDVEGVLLSTLMISLSSSYRQTLESQLENEMNYFIQ